MLYVDINVDYKENKDDISGYSYDEIVDIILEETRKYVVKGLDVIGIVLKRELYEWILYTGKNQSKFWNNVKRAKIESFYGFKVAVKE